MNPRRIGTGLRWGLALALAAGLVIWVQREFGWRNVLAPWAQLGLLDLGLVLGLVTAGHVARAQRLGHHFGPPVREHPGRSLRLLLIHNALNNLLPARTGELSFPVLLRREFDIGVTRSIAALVWLRLLDLGALLGVAAATLGVVEYGATLGIAVAVAVLLLPFAGWRVLRGRSDGAPNRNAWLERLRSGLPATPGALTATVAWTLLHWATKIVAYGWLVHRIADVPRGPAVLGAAAGELTSVLPIHGLAGAGTYEAGVILALRPLGIDLEPAVVGAVNLHLFVLVVSVMAASIALVFGRRAPLRS